MASNFQSSFIPKDPATSNLLKKNNTGIFGTLVILLFILSLVASVGLFVYKIVLKKNIETLRAEMAAAEGKMDKKSIEDIIHFNKKISLAKSIIDKHQVISGFLNYLATSTVSTVTFNSFQYGNLTGNGLSVSLGGYTNSYASLALQEDILYRNNLLKSINFSEIHLDDKGFVSFKVSMIVDPSMIVYKPPVIQRANSAATSTGYSQIEDEILQELESIEIE